MTKNFMNVVKNGEKFAGKNKFWENSLESALQSIELIEIL